MTIGPVPSPSIGSEIVTAPLAKLPITAPRPEMVIDLRASRTDSVPSLELATVLLCGNEAQLMTGRTLHELQEFKLEP